VIAKLSYLASGEVVFEMTSDAAAWATTGSSEESAIKAIFSRQISLR